MDALLRVRLGRTLELLGDDSLKNYPEVCVFASARITFVRDLAKSAPADPAFGDSMQLHECKWLIPNSSAGCSGEVVAKTQLHPFNDVVALDEREEKLARKFFAHHIAADDWFPIRSV
jgi:hypothetical protein